MTSVGIVEVRRVGKVDQSKLDGCPVIAVVGGQLVQENVIFLLMFTFTFSLFISSYFEKKRKHHKHVLYHATVAKKFTIRKAIRS